MKRFFIFSFLFLFFSACSSAPKVTHVVPGELTETSDLVAELEGSKEVKDKIRTSLVQADETLAEQQNKIAQLQSDVNELLVPATKYATLRAVFFWLFAAAGIFVLWHLGVKFRSIFFALVISFSALTFNRCAASDPGLLIGNCTFGIGYCQGECESGYHEERNLCGETVCVKN